MPFILLKLVFVFIFDVWLVYSLAVGLFEKANVIELKKRENNSNLSLVSTPM